MGKKLLTRNNINKNYFIHNTNVIVHLYFSSENEPKRIALLVCSSLKRICAISFRKHSRFTGSGKSNSSAKLLFAFTPCLAQHCCTD